jgi:hypothetical protein
MKETWNTGMQATANNQSCARNDDLIAYLYDEASEIETKDFERHAQHCVSCRAELADFRQVREAVGDWRTKSFGAFAAPAIETNARLASGPISVAPARRRSALAALREFFTLAPVWMRAATAFAMLAFCALAVIAFQHVYEQPKFVSVAQPTVARPTQKLYTPEQVREIVANNLKREHEATRESQPAKNQTVALATEQARPRVKRNNTVAPQNGPVQTPQVAKLKLSQQEQQEIVYGLAANKEDEDLPRLSDLLGDDSNESN